MSVRLILADDHAIFLDGLKQLLHASGEFEVVAACTSGDQALSAVAELAPDIVLIDLRMPGLGGIALLKEIRTRHPGCRVVILTAELTEPDLLEAIRLKVNGIVLKEMAPRLLLQCLRKVQNGGQWMEHRSTQAALEALLHREAGRRAAEKELTPREIVLVCLVAEGLRNKDIAARLHIAEGTVKTHLRNVYRKLNRDTRVAIRRYAEERGLV